MEEQVDIMGRLLALGWIPPTEVESLKEEIRKELLSERGVKASFDSIIKRERKAEREKLIEKVDRIIYDLACYDPELFDSADLIKTTQSVVSQWQALKEGK